MKSLLEQILESATPEEMLTFCKTQIENAETNLTPEIQKILSRMYNAATGEANTLIKTWLQQKDMSKDQIRCVLGLIADYDYQAEFTEIAANDGIIDPDDILSNQEGYLLDILTSGRIESLYQFSDEFMDELISTQPGQRGVTVGPAEIALMCLVKGCSQNSGPEKLKDEEMAAEIGSDLKMGKTGVEIKGIKAMLCSHKKPNAKKLLENIKKFTQKYNDGKEQREKIDIDLSSYNDKNGGWITALGSEGLKNFGEECFNDYIDKPQHKDAWLELLKSGLIQTQKQLLLSIALWSLLEYQSRENFHHILIINNDLKTRYHYLNIDFTKNPTLDFLYNLCQDKLIVQSAIRNANREELPKVTLI